MSIIIIMTTINITAIITIIVIIIIIIIITLIVIITVVTIMLKSRGVLFRLVSQCPVVAPSAWSLLLLVARQCSPSL